MLGYSRKVSLLSCELKPAKHILPIIVLAQFCCTSLWFASNGIMEALTNNFGLAISAMGLLTSAVQFGFISGTLMFAIFNITDRFSPSKVFFFCAVIGALSNFVLIWPKNTFFTLIAFRFLTGFFLAGIYPVGMKIAADYFDKGLGTSLGYLVGALVIGTAFPHLLNTFEQSLSWKTIVYTTSTLAIIGGYVIWRFVPDGPFRRPGQTLQWNAFFTVFQRRSFRTAAFGYFGHMWELYSFWTFIPIVLATFATFNSSVISIPFWSFVIIAGGGLACVIGAHLSRRFGPKKIARTALLLSALCCMALPLLFQVKNLGVFLSFMVFWGMVVIADSPLFSTLVAKNANPELKGTALTIVNCIGFAITILSIQALSILMQSFDSVFVYLVLIIGPIFGLFHLFRKKGQ
ncbi:MAG: MFS transporter [Croceivirga sp.]